MKPFFYLFLIIFSCLACQAPEKLLEAGKYDLILKRAGKIARRKETVSYKWAIASEEAFLQANEKDSVFIEMNEKEDDISSWKAAYYTARKINRRQERLKKVLPIKTDNGFTASFRFTDAITKMAQAKKQIGFIYYQLAMRQMSAARQGSKRAALTSIQLLDSALIWQPDLKRAYTLREEAIDSAKVRVAIYVDTDDNVNFPTEIFKEIFRMKLPTIYKKYLFLQFNPSNTRDIDYFLFIKPLYVHVGAEEEYSSTTCYSKEIVTGHKTEKEWNDKDSCWVTKTIEIRETVHATVTEYEQNKDADMAIDVSVEDVEYYHIYAQKKICAYDNFYNKYSELSGDDRAVDCFIWEGSMDFFPSDWSMKKNLCHYMANRLARYILKYNWWFD